MSWVRIRRDLVDGRAVQQLLELRLERGECCATLEHCLGWLVRVIVWGDAHCDVTGVTGVTPRTLGVVLGDAQAVTDLVTIGWLRVTRDGLVEFVDWDKHNSQGSRSRKENRSGDAERQARYRAKKKAEQAGGVVEAPSASRNASRDGDRDMSRNALRDVTPLEKRREEERNGLSVPLGSSPPGAREVPAPSADGRTDRRPRSRVAAVAAPADGPAPTHGLDEPPGVDPSAAAPPALPVSQSSQAWLVDALSSRSGPEASPPAARATAQARAVARGGAPVAVAELGDALDEPVAGFPWPDWVPADRRVAWVRAVHDGALALVECRSSPAWFDGVCQALAQLTAPHPGESGFALAVRQEAPATHVLDWLHRLQGRGPAYVTAALRQGPLSAVWQHPRLARDGARSRRDQEQRESREERARA